MRFDRLRVALLACTILFAATMPALASPTLPEGRERFTAASDPTQLTAAVAAHPDKIPVGEGSGDPFVEQHNGSFGSNTNRLPPGVPLPPDARFSANGRGNPSSSSRAGLQSPSTSASAERDWSIVPSLNTSPTQHNELYGVTCQSASDCWAVGSYSNPASGFSTLIQHWDGTSWAIVASPNQGDGENHLWGVTCVSSSDCWAVGSFFGRNNQTLIEHWDGASWTIVSSPDPTSNNPDNHLFDVTCVSESDCWAVGYALTNFSYQTLIERWDGTSWTVVPSPNSSTTEHHYLKGVTCPSASDCWAVGFYSDSTRGNQTLTLHWDGISWALIPSPTSLPTQTNRLYTVSCVSASDCWAVGNSFTAQTLRTLIEHWDGNSWVIVSSPNTGLTGDNFLYSVSCVSASDCWAAGYGRGDSTIQTLIEHWDGTSWAIVSSPNTSPTRAHILYGVTCVSASECMAVGYTFNGDHFVETLTLRYAASPVPDATSVTFTDRNAPSGQYSDATMLEARLTDSDGDPIVDSELTFELTSAESARSFIAATDDDGVATVTPVLTEKPGPYNLTVRYAGDDAYEGKADMTAFVVEKEDTTLELSVHGEDDDKTLRAQLSDLDTPSAGIAERTIDFYSDGELIGSHQTDTDGGASVALPPGHRGNNRTYEVVFEGDDFYTPSSDSRSGRGRGQADAGGTTNQAGRSYRMTVFL